MLPIRTYIILMGILLMASCSGERKEWKRLAQIDGLLYECPDSASSLLKGMQGQIDNCTESLRAYYDLLTIKADVETNHKHPSDSLILQVIDYYEQNREYEHLAEAYFYAGMVFGTMKDNGHRVLYYCELAQFCDTAWLNDYWRSRIFAKKGYIYMRNNMYDEARDMLEMSQMYSRAFGDTAGIRFCQENIQKVHRQEVESPIDSATLMSRRQVVMGINERARMKFLKLQNDRLEYQQQGNGSLWLWIAAGVLVLAGATGVLSVWKRQKARLLSETASSPDGASVSGQSAPRRRQFFDAELSNLLSARIRANKVLRAADWKLIEERLLANYPNFRSELYSHYPMSENEYRICLLIKMEVTPSNIAKLLAMGNSSISQSRLRMQQKVFNGQGTARDWDAYVLSL